jgi:pimeloyl-ACP methyl ester carboxylesterase
MARRQRSRTEQLPPARLLAGVLLPSRARRRALRALPVAPPLTPIAARTVDVPGRGEYFVRDSGGEGPAVLLLHGWLASADLNWLHAYGPLVEAGYRVLALDHRGHGRGLRTHAPFALVDCADDAAAVVNALGCGPVICCGYSMGGPITQLLARRHRHLVRGMVMCATTREFQGPGYQRQFRQLWLLRTLLTLAPRGTWTAVVRLAGWPVNAETAWLTAELARGSTAAVIEAGRELSRFDSRPWLDEVAALPSAVVVTTRDIAVSPRMQRELAEHLGAETFEVDGDHFVAGAPDGRFNVGLLAALAHVGTL